MQATPYALVSAATEVGRASKRELIGLSRQLERAALEQAPPAVAATLQDVRHLTDRTRAVYADLAAAGAAARLHARGLQAWLAPGVEGVALDARTFTYGVSHDPHVVAACGRLLGI